MSNLFDRNSTFKDAVKAKAEEFLNKLKVFAVDHTVNYINVIRSEGLTNK